MFVHTLNYVIIFSRQEIDLWIAEIDGIKFRNKRNNTVKQTLPFKEGWMISLRAISLLVDDLFQLDGISFVLTRRLNQDPLEVSYFLFSNNEEGFKLRSTSVYCLYVKYNRTCSYIYSLHVYYAILCVAVHVLGLLN